RTSRRTVKRPSRMTLTLRATRSSRPQALMSTVASALPKTVSPMVKISNLCPMFEVTQTLGRENAEPPGLGELDLARATGATVFFGGGGDWARAAEAKQMRRKAIKERCMRLPWLCAAPLDEVLASHNPTKPKKCGRRGIQYRSLPKSAS